MSLRRTPWSLSFAMFVALALPGCGFKGDLLHPEADEPQPDKAEPAERDPVPE